MKREDDFGAIIVLIIGLAIIAFIVYCIFLLATLIATVAAASGTLYGGGTAIGNYFLSFKENIIDSNKQVIVA